MLSFDDLKRDARRQLENDKKREKTSTASWESLKQSARQQNTIGIDQNYISSFFTDAQNYLRGASESYNGMGYANRESVFTSQKKTADDLRSRSGKIRAYLNGNKASLKEEDYNSLVAMLDDFDKSAASIYDAFSQKNEGFSQWDSEDSYIRGALDEVEARQQRYENNKAEIANLQAEKKKLSSAQVSNNTYAFGDTSMGFFVPATDPSYGSRIKDIDAQIAALEAENQQYERGEGGFVSKVRDDYYSITQQPGFAVGTASRDYSNPTKEEFRILDVLNNNSYWKWDEANGVYRDAFGNVLAVDENNTYYNPAAQKYQVEDKLGLYLSASDDERVDGTHSAEYEDSAWGSYIKEGYNGAWEYLTAPEQEIYYTLLESDQEAAYKYLADMDVELNRRRTLDSVGKWAQQYDDAGFLEKIALNAATVPAKFFSNITGSIENSVNALQGEDINPYSVAHGGMHYSQTVRGATANELDATGFKIPVIDFTLGDIYQTGMSRLDSALATSVFGGGGTVFLGMGAAQDEAYRLYKQGASAEQITVGSFAAGAAEAIWENLSYGKLKEIQNIGDPGAWVKSILIQGFNEASEEALTEVSNIISNALVMGSQSDLAELYQQNEEDAFRTFVGLVKQTTHSAFGGFLGGIGAGATQSTGVYVDTLAKYAESGNTIRSADGGAKALENFAMSVAGATEGKLSNSIKKQAGKVSSEVAIGKGFGKIGAAVKNFNRDVQAGRLYNDVMTAQNAQNKADIARSLQEKGFNAETANDIATVLVAEYTGQNLSFAQRRLLESAMETQVVKQVVADIIGNEQSTMGQREANIRGFNAKIVDGIVTKAVAKAQPTAAAQPAETPAATYDVSADGVTTDKDGNAVNIVGVESTENGKLLLRTENGTIDSGDVVYASEADALVYEAVANMGATPASAWDMIKAATEDGGVSATEYATAAPLAYLYGKLGYEKGVFSNGKPRLSLTEKQSATIYQMGRSDADASVKATSQVDTRATISEKNADKEIIYEGFTYSKRKANPLQRASMEAIELINKVSSLEVHVYRSVKEGGKFYAVVDGKKRIAPNGYFMDGNKIFIDINAGNEGRGAMLFTMAHEIGHYIAEYNAADFKAISDFLFEHYGEDAPIYEELRKKKETLIESYKRDGKPVPEKAQLEKEAQEELVCDMLSRMLADQYAYDKLMELKKENLNAFQKLGEAIKKFLDKIAKFIGIYDTQATDFQMAASVETFGEEAFRQLQDLYIKAFVQADANFQAAEVQKNTTEDGGVKLQSRMTDADIQAVQGIGRISVNQFSSAAIKATERFARQYWEEMGVKSPFFRAWFGDWRVNDQTKVRIANKKGDTRGAQQNTDTGWDVQVSGQVFAESKHFAKKNKSAMPYLPYINDIVEKAVLLDSYGIDIRKAKSQNSLLMHSLYAIADIGHGPELLKLYVEEMNDPNSSDTAKRAYQLQNIEKASAVNGGVQGNAPSSLANTTNAIRTVADLFAAVKQKDADFKPNAASTIVNADGTPKVVYHGSADQFNIFSYGHIGSASGVSILGDGFYFGDKKRLAKNYGENVYECYLQMKKPYQATEADAYKLNTKKLQNQGYDGVILESPSGKIYMVFDNTQIKSATDNIGSFDGSNADIRYSDRDYSYEALTSKPDMVVTTVGGNVPNNRADVVHQAKKNAAKVGTFNPKDGSVSVHVDDIDVDVVVGTAGLKHSLDRRFNVNAPVTLQAGLILQNSIQINELTPQHPNAQSSYVLIGAAKTKDGQLYIVRSVVNRFSQELTSMDVLYAFNGKTEPDLGKKRKPGGRQSPMARS